jgi:hypothetical protein
LVTEAFHPRTVLIYTLGEQGPDFFDPACIYHLPNPVLDSMVQLVSWSVEGDHDRDRTQPLRLGRWSFAFAGEFAQF